MALFNGGWLANIFSQPAYRGENISKIRKLWRKYQRSAASVFSKIFPGWRRNRLMASIAQLAVISWHGWPGGGINGVACAWRRNNAASVASAMAYSAAIISNIESWRKLAASMAAAASSAAAKWRNGSYQWPAAIMRL